MQSGAVSSTQTYTYDANDRLTSVCFQAGSCPGGSDPFIRWSYDKVGNRLTEARPTGTTNSTYNGLDELTQAGPTAYSYDQNGNETAAGSRSFTYDLANRLKTTTSGSTTTTYTYDGDGTRLQASTGTQASKKTNFLWDTNQDLPQLALERDGNNTLLRRYLYGSRRISMTTGGNTYYYHYDPLGSVRNLTSATGVTQWTDTYEPYGAIRTETQNATGAPTNPIKFTGEYLDPTALYYLRARQYDATTGRFLSTDSGPRCLSRPSVSTYAYANDQPTILVDPSGATFQPASDGVDRAWLATTPEGVSAERECNFVRVFKDGTRMSAQTTNTKNKSFVAWGYRLGSFEKDIGAEMFIQVKYTINDFRARAPKDRVEKSSYFIHHTIGPNWYSIPYDIKHKLEKGDEIFVSIYLQGTGGLVFSGFRCKVP